MEQRNDLYGFILGCMLLLCTQSCKVSKHLEKNSYIYKGTELNIADKHQAQSISNFNRLINYIPEAGSKTGIGHINFGLYNLFEETGDTGFKHWVKNKLGKKPIIYNEDLLSKTEKRLSYYLNGKGFFSHELDCSTSLDTHFATINCDVNLGERYVINTLSFPEHETYESLRLNDERKRVVLEEGSYYDRDRLDYERLRIAALAGDKGYADFGSDMVHYYVDTALVKSAVDIYMKIISPIDSTTHTRYIVDTIKVFPNYSIDNPNKEQLDMVKINDRLLVYESEHYLNHELIQRLIIQRPNLYLSRTKEQKSISKMLDLGLFRFINFNHVPNPSLGKGHYNQEIYLTPELIQTVSGEVEINNRSGNYLGTGISANYTHRNVFKQAAVLKASIGGQVETQFGGGVSLVNSSDLTAGVQLSFPKTIVPFFEARENRNYIPRTSLKTNYTSQRRTGYYTLKSITGKMGYRWRENARRSHELYPLFLNYVNVTNKTPEFSDILAQDPRLQSAFQDVLIGGIQYVLTYNGQSGSSDVEYSQFKAGAELTGNLFSLVSREGEGERREVAGLPYAQYLELTLDYRRYLRVRKSILAGRFLTGTGITFGNSKELPYVKQYLIGGSSSLRAFRLRGLGPGSFFVDPTNLSSFEAQFVDQTGDMKLELNLEYRFPIFRFLKGATFIDSGNIWLINNDEIPEGNFRFKEFYKQIALGTGFGLRLDFEFFILRLDAAFQLRGPTVSEGFQWKINEIDFLSSNWRSQNIVYNLGIGYPF